MDYCENHEVKKKQSRSLLKIGLIIEDHFQKRIEARSHAAITTNYDTNNFEDDNLTYMDEYGIVSDSSKSRTRFQ